MLFLKLLLESFVSSRKALTENKLRSFLSLLGIVIGIFSIISVFTMVDALNKKISDSVSSLGDNVVYVQKWPWIFSEDYPWWKYINRPLPKPEEMPALRERMTLGEAAAFSANAGRTIQYGNIAMNDIRLNAVSDNYENVANFEIASGRYLTDAELRAGRAVGVIGAEIATNLFGEDDPVGKVVSIRGTKITIVGMFKREGDNLFGNTMDNQLIVPIEFGRGLMKIDSDNTNPFIMVKAKPGVKNEDLIAELEGIMRQIRHIKPIEEPDFALNQTSMISQGFKPLFGMVNIAGWIIGIFSIIVGGFGIANIMFVSVKERTNIIGIKKSLGAKSYFILFEFLFEAIMLCIIGGAIGLLLIYLLTLFANAVFDVGVDLTMKNISIAMIMSVLIGLLAGIIPAYSASRLNPVDAIRSK